MIHARWALGQVLLGSGEDRFGVMEGFGSRGQYE